MKKRYSLLLLSPGHVYSNMWALKELGALMNKSSASIPLALPLLAAITPDHYDITLVDEESSPIDFDRDWDLVGISSIMTNVDRAYEISARFRARGIPVILGGPYSSLNHEESLGHADTVVVGEAEDLWPGVLADFESGDLKPVYKAEGFPSIGRQPIPRWDLIDTRQTLSLNVQISRGCPNGCDFCCVPAMFGYKQRYREIDNVVEEIRSLPIKQLSFVDDNFTADREYARELCERLIPLEVSWNCLCDSRVARDRELLDLMAAAGCHTILIGFESLDPESLAIAKAKRNRVAEYRDVVAAINGAGIHVTGAFVVGFDGDTLEAFDDIYDFYMETDVSYVMLNILTAFPGTRLHADLAAQGRTWEVPSRFLTGVFPSFDYKPPLTPMGLFEKNLDAYERIYSYDIVYDKMMRLYANGNYVHPRRNIGMWSKVSGMGSVFRRFVLSGDPRKRALIRRVFGLIQTGKLRPDLIFEYLFFVESANDYIARYRGMRERLVEDMETYLPGTRTTD